LRASQWWLLPLLELALELLLLEELAETELEPPP
jgi:hypothetical protein